MGGNAFKHLNVCRLFKKEYYKLADDIQSLLTNHFPSMVTVDVQSYYNKILYRDLDILFYDTNNTNYEDIATKINAISMIRNGPVTSFAVHSPKGLFQVDLIRVKPEEFYFASAYFAYNDLGNLMGRVAHRMGFKLGHQGLRYIIRDKNNSDHVLKDVVVTQDWCQAVEFLGYDYFKWCMGFKNINSMFRYAVSNPEASVELFRLDQVNHVARIRDRKRKNYNLFLKWLQDPKNGIKEKSDMSKQELRERTLLKAFELFPTFKQEYDAAQALQERIDIGKQKFNGSLIQELTGLTDKNLGDFISKFIKEYIEDTCKYNKTDWCFEKTAEDIKNAVLMFVNKC
jgi:hypothetical protein